MYSIGKQEGTLLAILLGLMSKANSTLSNIAILEKMAVSSL